MKPILIILSVLMSCLPVFSQTGPGGVGGHEDEIEEGDPVNCLWLRADDLLDAGYTDGEEVDEWEDIKSGYDFIAVFPGGRDDLVMPVLEADMINGLPWVRFPDRSFLEMEDNDILDGRSGIAIFAVSKRDAITAENQDIVSKRRHWNAWSHVEELTEFDLQHAYEMRWGGKSMICFLNGNFPDGAGQDVFADTLYGDLEKTYLVSFVYNTVWGGTIRIGGVNDQNPARYEGNPNPIVLDAGVINSDAPLYVGAAMLDPPGHRGDESDNDPAATEQNFLNGEIAELIIINGELDSTEMILVENYLQAKYNLELLSEYDYYQDTEYTSNMIGIGTETGGRDVHPMSNSGILGLEVLNNSLDSPKEYLIAASNGTEPDLVMETIGDQNVERWTTIWKFEKTGNLDAKLSFNFSEAGITMGLPQDYGLLFREHTDSTFTILDIAPTERFKTLYFEVADEMLTTGYYTVGKYTEDPSGLSQINSMAKLKIFPNPVSDLLGFRYESKHNGLTELMIYDYSGRAVHRERFTKTSQILHEGIEVHNLQPGLYMLEIRCGKKPTTDIFIIN